MIKLGSSTIKEMYLGSKKIKLAYLGSTLMYSSEAKPSITVDLNNQWLTSSIGNPDPSLYNIYESYSNYNVNSGVAIMVVTISGLTEFTCYIRSNAESNFDYVMIGQLDIIINGSTSYSSSDVKAHTRGNQQSGTALSSYTLVTYSNIDGGTHTISVVYLKDNGVNNGTDKGYILIPKSTDVPKKITATITVSPQEALEDNGGYVTIQCYASSGSNHTSTANPYTFECTEGVTYSVSVEPIEGWITPYDDSFVAGLNGTTQHNITMTYVKESIPNGGIHS